MIVFAVERYAQCGLEIAAAAVDHEREMGRYDGVFVLDPNLDTYQKLDAVDALHFVTAREDGLLLGYAIFIIMPHSHYRNVLWAAGDGLWLDHLARRPRVAARMLDAIEDSLRARGVVLVSIPTHPDRPALARLLESRDYRIDSLGFARRL